MCADKGPSLPGRVWPWVFGVLSGTREGRRRSDETGPCEVRVRVEVPTYGGRDTGGHPVHDQALYGNKEDIVRDPSNDLANSIFLGRCLSYSGLDYFLHGSFSLRRCAPRGRLSVATRLPVLPPGPRSGPGATGDVYRLRDERLVRTRSALADTHGSRDVYPDPVGTSESVRTRRPAPQTLSMVDGAGVEESPRAYNPRNVPDWDRPETPLWRG